MKRGNLIVLGVLATAFLTARASSYGAGTSPYAGDASRSIKALSADEIGDLRAGRGMGLSKAAELNRQPGPRHVLDLAVPLALSTPQREDIQAIFDRMARDARSVGAEIVDRERTLDALFARSHVPRSDAEHAVAEIAGLQGRLRFIHLDAHLRTTQHLTPEQVTLYDRLRGYELADPTRVPAVHHDH